jgi:concanavalin A-like lectin/glucanase superfamily protein
MSKLSVFVAGLCGCVALIATVRHFRSAPEPDLTAARATANLLDANVRPRGFAVRTEPRAPLSDESGTEGRKAAGGSMGPGRRGEGQTSPAYAGAERIRVAASLHAAPQAIPEAAGTLAESGQKPGAGSPTAELPGDVDPDVVFQTGNDQEYNTDAQAEVTKPADISAEAGTLSFWLKPQWDAGSADDASFIDIGAGQLQISKHLQLLRFGYTDTTGAPAGLSVPIENWKPDEWHQIATTWTNDQLEVYIDGRRLIRMPHDNPFEVPPDSKVYVGSNFAAGVPVAPGLLHAIEARNRVLSAGEIADQFLAGRPSDS